jgi:hypothetical protein
MKAVYISVLLFTVVLFFYAGGFKMGIKPFFIKFETPFVMFAIIFLAISVSCFRIHVSREAFKDGVDQTIKRIEQLLQERRKV